MSLYRALNEEDVMKARFDLMEDGDYDAVVKSSIQSMSRSNNVMADMSVSVFDKAGNAHDIRDFLVFNVKMLWKIKHFCDSSGQEKIYADEKFTPEMAANQHVRVRIRTQKGNEIPFEKLNGKPVGSCYPDKNVIEDYLPGKSDVPGKPADEFLNDLIPF
jgi:hypothetical protein